MPHRRHALTPEALEMMDTIATTGSFAAAARELGKVPSALTYSVRQLEESLDALLFDRRSRQAQLTPAGEELLREGRRLLQQMDTVANRVMRVATGWETELAIAVDNIVAPAALFDLIEAFYQLPSGIADTPGAATPDAHRGPPTRLRLRDEVMAGTWEALLTGRADLAIGVMPPSASSDDIQTARLGPLNMVLAVAPHHPLARERTPLCADTIAQHRIVAIADSAKRMDPMTMGVQAGQDVLTVASLAAKLEAQLRGLGCGRLPENLVRRHADAGRLVILETEEPQRATELHYAWRRSAAQGRALAWWLSQLDSPTTRRALMEQHAGLVL
ncbi:MAG: LysR family transcriptional regulator [Leptothrix sp. (in: b-proteobacteria)]